MTRGPWLLILLSDLGNETSSHTFKAQARAYISSATPQAYTDSCRQQYIRTYSPKDVHVVGILEINDCSIRGGCMIYTQSTPSCKITLGNYLKQYKCKNRITNRTKYYYFDQNTHLLFITEYYTSDNTYCTNRPMLFDTN